MSLPAITYLLSTALTTELWGDDWAEDRCSVAGCRAGLGALGGALRIANSAEAVAQEKAQRTARAWCALPT